MYSALRNPRPGMQVHAVPEAERTVDATGRRLPWGYEYGNNLTSGPGTGAGANPDTERREPIEKGPFGRSMRRTGSRASRSRSKTAEPRREEDRIRAENMAAEDAIFGSMRRTSAKEETRRDGREALGLGAEVDPNTPGTQQPATRAPAAVAAVQDGEPTEVMLFGFGENMQWAAIDFYERVSGGNILEDYERTPPGVRFDTKPSLGRQAAQKSLSRAAMRKKNTYRGGNHWIKITFDSSQAADLAISRQPHIIKGYNVSAAYYTGAGPTIDGPVPATQGGVHVEGELPPSFATGHAGADGSPNASSSTTATSATATQASRPPWGVPFGVHDSPASSSTMNSGERAGRPESPSTPTPAASQFRTESIAAKTQTQTPRRRRIEGATIPEGLREQKQIFAAKPAKASWSTIIGASEVIGSAVPRKEDGSFDWDRASLYWRLFFWIDTVFGTDFCGLKTDE